MSRSVDEWIAKHDDQPIPPRVELRVFEKFGGRCVICTLKIAGSLRPATDHIRALINGGEHRESNLQLLCVPCHKVKTRSDVAEKSKMYEKRLKAVGIRKRSTLKGQGFNKAAPQRSASRPLEKRT